MTGSTHSLTKVKASKPTEGKVSKSKRIPGYLLHKPTGQARVRIDGRDYYLGEYGSEKSRVKYGEIIAKHAGGVPVDPFIPKLDDEADPGLTVNELALAFKKHAKGHYVKNGVVTSEVHCFNQALRPLVDLYGMTPVDDFGPLALKAVRDSMIDSKWVRKSINRAIARVRHIFRWGVENELVNATVLLKLQAVSALQAGRTEAEDNAPREVVPEDHIKRVKADVSKLVADLIDLQRLIGCRSGELLSLTTGMIDRSGPVWIATLADHKNAHHGQRRFLAIGPKAQEILRKYLSANPDQRLFKMRPSAYCRAISRSCDRLKIDRWFPHRLRHTAATRAREKFDLEHAQSMLGHAKAKMTEEYAKVAMTRAVAVAMKIG